MKKHVDLLAILFIVYHSIGLMIALGLTGILSAAGLFSGDPQAAGILALVSTVVFTLLLAVSAPGIVAGVGLLKRWWWARILALVVAFLNLICFPLGTALGVYTFWVLMQDGTVAEFDEAAHPVG